MADWLDEAESLFAEPDMSAMFTPAPAAPAPTQLQSLIDQPTRAPTDVELGVAQLRAMSPLEQTAAELEGRKLLFQEGLSFGVLPKVGAAATSLKEALYGTPVTEAFGQAVTQQDILKEFVRQQELEKENLILGLTGPELAGGLVSPIGRLYTPTKVAAGTPLASALATRGLNIGKAAGTGAGAAGLQTFLSTPGTLEERLAAAGESAETGAMFGGGFGTLGEVVSAAAPKLQQFGKAARRSAIGATAADYKKTAGKRNFVPKEEGVYTLTQQGIDNVIEKGYLGNSLDPLMQSDNLETAVRSIENNLDAKISQVDTSGVTVKTPQFIKLARDIQTGKFGGVNRDKYAAKLAEIKTDISAQRANKLQYLQDQKKYYGSLYEPSGTTADAKFNRAVYHELQAAIENYVPEAKKLNEEVQSLILTRPIIERRKAQAGAAGNQFFNALARATYTTGGIFGAGAALAGAGPLTSALLSAGTRGAATPTGRNLIGQALTGGGLGTGGAALGLRAGQLASRPEIELIPRETPVVEEATKPETGDWLNEAESLFVEPTPAPAQESVKVGKQNISIPTGEEYSEPRLVKAVIAAESAFNPNAVSPKGAGGLMQIMPATAKDLGLTKEQRFDPDKNVEAGSRYLKQLENQFGDEKVALAAYNWGMGNVSNAAKKLKAEGEPVTWENIKSIVKVPSETRQYVDRVVLLRKYDDFDLAKIAAHPKVGEAKLDKILAKYKTGKKFTVGDILDELGLDAKDVRVKRGNVLQSASDLTEA